LELTISLPHGDERLVMMGSAEQNLKILRDSLGVKISARDGTLRLSGGSRAVGEAAEVLERLSQNARHRKALTQQEVMDIITTVQAQRGAIVGEGEADEHEKYQLDVYSRRQHVKALTDGQRLYLDAIAHHDLTFCTGPAGTGKTYLAVASAVTMLKHDQVRRLVLVRPAVEAGEKLGFLPGNMQEKVNPYLRPLMDALHDMMDYDQIQRFMATDLIEIVPLAFMRGRTLNDALIILDEAQNTTRQQMLMFLTRLGHGSKMIVTGDTSQIDLPDPTQSGLIDAVRRLRRVPGAAFVALRPRDIVRHSLVQRIVDAYDQTSPRAADHGANHRPNQPTGSQIDAANPAGLE